MKQKLKIYVSLLATLCMVLGISALAASPKAEISFSPDAIIATEDKTYEMVDGYVQDIRLRNEALVLCDVDEINTTITFSEYLSFQEFKEYIESYDLEVAQLQARGLTQDGTRVSIFSRTDKGLEETEQILCDEALSEGFDFIGITGANVRISPKQLDAISEDSRTYLADTSGALTAQKSEIAEREELRDWFPQSLTWDLEDLGILVPG